MELKSHPFADTVDGDLLTKSQASRGASDQEAHAMSLRVRGGVVTFNGVPLRSPRAPHYSNGPPKDTSNPESDASTNPLISSSRESSTTYSDSSSQDSYSVSSSSDSSCTDCSDKTLSSASSRHRRSRKCGSSHSRGYRRSTAAHRSTSKRRSIPSATEVATAVLVIQSLLKRGKAAGILELDLAESRERTAREVIRRALRHSLPYSDKDTKAQLQRLLALEVSTVSHDNRSSGINATDTQAMESTPSGLNRASAFSANRNRAPVVAVVSDARIADHSRSHSICGMPDANAHGVQENSGYERNGTSPMTSVLVDVREIEDESVWRSSNCSRQAPRLRIPSLADDEKLMASTIADNEPHRTDIMLHSEKPDSYAQTQQTALTDHQSVQTGISQTVTGASLVSPSQQCTSMQAFVLQVPEGSLPPSPKGTSHGSPFNVTIRQGQTCEVQTQTIGDADADPDEALQKFDARGNGSGRLKTVVRPPRVGVPASTQTFERRRSRSSKSRKKSDVSAAGLNTKPCTAPSDQINDDSHPDVDPTSGANSALMSPAAPSGRYLSPQAGNSSPREGQQIVQCYPLTSFRVAPQGQPWSALSHNWPCQIPANISPGGNTQSSEAIPNRSNKMTFCSEYIPPSSPDAGVSVGAASNVAVQAVTHTNGQTVAEQKKGQMKRKKNAHEPFEKQAQSNKPREPFGERQASVAAEAPLGTASIDGEPALTLGATGPDQESLVEFPPPPHLLAPDMPPPGTQARKARAGCCDHGGDTVSKRTRPVNSTDHDYQSESSDYDHCCSCSDGWCSWVSHAVRCCFPCCYKSEQ